MVVCNVSSNPMLTLVVATHQNHVNNHNELDTVCPHYNAMFGVHDIERFNRVMRHHGITANVLPYLPPCTYDLTVYTKYAVSLSLGWKIHRVTSIGIKFTAKRLGKIRKKKILFFKIITHLIVID